MLVVALILAIVSPFIYALMNVLDKYIISRKVKKAFSFSVVGGIINLVLGIVIALFLSWEGITLNQIFWPALAGLLLGSQFYLYYYTLQKEDASSLIGLIYLYPLIVAFLSFFFLNERFSFASYVGLAIIIMGVFSLSGRIKKTKSKMSIIALIAIIFAVALDEFFIKIATDNLSELHGMSINLIFIGVSLLPLLVHKSTRIGFYYEIKNTGWAVLSEIFTFLGMGTLYFAMAELPATIVSSVAAIQPLAVLFIERAAHARIGKMSRDYELLPKLIPIALIVIGVILLYLPEIYAVL